MWIARRIDADMLHTKLRPHPVIRIVARRFLEFCRTVPTIVFALIFVIAFGLGPMAGQNHHFVRYAPEKLPYAITRYVNETGRLYGVLNTRLAGRSFIAGADYSIADIACYPWIVPYEAQGQKLEDFPHLQRWFEAIRARPATVLGEQRSLAASGGALRDSFAPLAVHVYVVAP